MENTGEQVYAKLGADKLSILKETESAMGSTVLLAYQPEQLHQLQAAKSQQKSKGWKIARLDQSQMDYLINLEQKIDAVVVAYSKAE